MGVPKYVTLCPRNGPPAGVVKPKYLLTLSTLITLANCTSKNFDDKKRSLKPGEIVASVMNVGFLAQLRFSVGSEQQELGFPILQIDDVTSAIYFKAFSEFIHIDKYRIPMAHCYIWDACLAATHKLVLVNDGTYGEQFFEDIPVENWTSDRERIVRA